jgi:hypothetical protein
MNEMNENEVIIQLNKESVFTNFMNYCNIINDTGDFAVTFFGFIFSNEYMNIDLTNQYWGFDKIIDYIKNKSFDDLLFYFFDADFDNNIYIYSYDNTYISKNYINSFSKLCNIHNFDDDNNILLRIDKNWYN